MDRPARKEIYRNALLSGVRRVLNELDRDPFSSTYGSFDREYWAWATKDFSNIDLQRAVYPLTTLYLNRFDGNIWFAQEKVKEWILAGVRYWGKAQHRDGSFDHHYPNEHSFVGAAFTLYEIAQAFVQLENAGKMNDRERADWISAMIKTADFLCRNDEGHGFISNHRIGAACALYTIFRLTGNEKYRERAYYFIRTIRDKMSKKEGWLFEYTGFDPGYQTLDTYYLANFYLLTQDEKILNDILVPSIEFLAYFFHPDGSVGGEYGSRNCPLYFPSGFELLAGRLRTAEAIAAIGAHAAADGKSPYLSDHDIRNFVPMLSSYAQAFVSMDGQPNARPATLPFEREFERYWPEAGIFIRSDKRRYIILGLSKGGVIKVFDKDSKKLIASHPGYMVETDKGKALSNQFSNPVEIPLMKDCDSGEGAVATERVIDFAAPFFFVMKNRIMTPVRFLIFRLYNLTLSRIPYFNLLLRRRLITDLFIHRRKKSDIKLRRRIVLSESEMIIKDEMHGSGLKDIKGLYTADLFTTIYMGSSKYYRDQELIEKGLQGEVNMIRKVEPDRTIRITTKIGSGGMVFTDQLRADRE
jgi:hypothetical protein